METNNFTNQENIKKLENSNLEKEIDIIDGEGALELEAKIKALETKNQEEINKYNQIRSELGLDTLDSKNEEAVIVELPSLSSRFQKIKNIGKNLLKAGAFAGVMFGATDTFSQTSNTSDKNPEKIEVVQKRANLLETFKKNRLVSPDMKFEDFQNLTTEEVDNLFKEYAKIMKIKYPATLQPGSRVIYEEEKNYDVDTKTGKESIVKVSNVEKNAYQIIFDKWFASQYAKVKKGEIKDGAIVLYNNSNYVNDPNNGKSFKLTLNPNKEVFKQKRGESNDNYINKNDVVISTKPAADHFKKSN